MGPGQCWARNEHRGLPVFIGLEQTVDDHISGLIGTFQSYRENSSAGTWNHQFYGVGLKGNYHFIELAPTPYDFFAGLTVSWSAHRFRWAGTGAAPGFYDGSAIGGTGLSAQIGGRYTYKGTTFLVQLDGGTLNSGFLAGLSFPCDAPVLMRFPFVLALLCLVNTSAAQTRLAVEQEGGAKTRAPTPAPHGAARAVGDLADRFGPANTVGIGWRRTAASGWRYGSPIPLSDRGRRSGTGTLSNLIDPNGHVIDNEGRIALLTAQQRARSCWPPSAANGHWAPATPRPASSRSSALDSGNTRCTSSNRGNRITQLEEPHLQGYDRLSGVGFSCPAPDANTTPPTARPDSKLGWRP